MLSLPSSTSTPSRSKAARIETKWSGSIPSIVSSPPVTAASPMKLAASMCSAPIRWLPRRRATRPPRSAGRSSRSRRCCAPSSTRKRQRSWTCGSQAALISVVSPSREHGRHHGVLGAHHARLAEEDLGGRAAGRSAARSGARRSTCGAERLEGVDVGVERAAADEVASRRREHDVAAARQQRPREQERAADPLGKHLVDLGMRDLLGTDAQLVVAHPFGVDAEIDEKREHRLDVADARHVRDRHRLGREQRRSDDRERAVLVAGDADPAAERPAALDHERFRRCLPRDCALHGGGYPSWPP